MKKIAAAAALSLGVWLLVPIQHADAAERCVTRVEFRKVKVGMKKARVHSIFDSSGRKSYSVGRFESRNYTPCTDRQFGWVVVSYKDGRVYAKDASW